MNNNKHIQAVLFDLDDTLLDWSGLTLNYKQVSRPHMNKVYDYLAADQHSLPPREHFLSCYIDTVISNWDEARKTWTGINFSNVLHDFFTRLELNGSQIDVTAVLQAYDMQPMPGVISAQAYTEALQQIHAPA